MTLAVLVLVILAVSTINPRLEKTVIAAPATPDAYWFIKTSVSSFNEHIAEPWGAPIAVALEISDVPVPGDYDGDGKADLAVWQQQDFRWRIKLSSTGGTLLTRPWGGISAPYYDSPVQADYDGDGKTDPAVFRRSTNTWWILRSLDNFAEYSSFTWGSSGEPHFDIPVPGDYDGDGRSDLAVWRQSDYKWYVSLSSGSTLITQPWGSADEYQYADVPVQADYDGDGKTDPAVWRQTDNRWWILKSTGQFTEWTNEVWGNAGSDLAVLGDYDNDNRADMAVWRARDFTFHVKLSAGGTLQIPWGSGAYPYYDLPVPGDYDGDGKTDLAVWRKGQPLTFADAQQKAVYHKFTGRRSGMVQTLGGVWNVQDHAYHMVNTSTEHVDVYWKLISDDPNFTFRDGSVGTWTGKRHVLPSRGRSENVTGAEGYPFPVPAYSNFVGTSEFYGCVTGSNPCVPASFYVYLLPETIEATGPDPNAAWFAAWNVWNAPVPTYWDAELGAWLVPYTNYWHNRPEFEKGWYSSLTMANSGASNYRLKHVADSYSLSRNPACVINYFGVQEIPLFQVQGGVPRTENLQSLFGWHAGHQSAMEGYLLIYPLSPNAAPTITNEVLPNQSGSAICGV